MQVTVRVRNSTGAQILHGVVITGGKGAAASFTATTTAAGAHLLLGGARSYHVRLDARPDAAGEALLRDRLGKRVTIRFSGRRTYRQRLEALGGRDLVALPEGEAPELVAPAIPGVTPGVAPEVTADAEQPTIPESVAGALHLNASIYGVEPLYLLPEGTLAGTPEGPAPTGLDALGVMVTAARWVSSRRISSFERLFPESAFHPDVPPREDRLSVAQAAALLDQLAAIVEAAAITIPTEGADEAADEAALEAAIDRAQLRSAALTVLAHVVATAATDPEFRGPADRAVAMILELVASEASDGGRPELRAHAIQLLAQRGPALTAEQGQRVQELLRGLRRQAPPYAELDGPWRFALCAAHDFHRGGVAVLKRRYGFKEITAPEETPTPPPTGGSYVALEAPFTGPKGQPIQIFARSTSPRYENAEMGEAFFTGLMINRHANLGAADVRATQIEIVQRGYKLMLNAQCAGLTTRFAIARMFPEADIYSSWDSTYFRTGADGELSASEGIDCFIAVLRGMSAGEDFAAIDARLRAAQWYHKQNHRPDFIQFIGPSHPQVVRRFEDINRDGKADYYDGFLDLRLVEIAEDLAASATPRDPGVAPSQIAGAAAVGLSWAAGSLNRVTQYSELWDELPGKTELFYAFRAGGFFSHHHPPQDIPLGSGPPIPLGTLPAVTRYLAEGEAGAEFAAEVMCHAWLSHTAQELKRLLLAADAFWRAIDLGHLGGRAPLDTPEGRRGALLITLAALLEYPADQNMLDALWGKALAMLGLPPLSRSLIRRCISDEDRSRGDYYGSRRGVMELVGGAGEIGRLEAADPLAYAILCDVDPSVGRALPLEIASTPGG